MAKHIKYKAVALSIVMFFKIYSFENAQKSKRLTCDISHLVGEADKVTFQDSGDLLISSKSRSGIITLRNLDKKSLTIKDIATINNVSGNIGDICFLTERNLVGFVRMSGHPSDSSVNFFDASRGTLVKTLSLGWAHKFCGKTPNGKKLLISTSDTREIGLIDIESLELKKKLKMEESTFEIAHCPQKKLLVLGFDSATMTVVKNYNIENEYKIKIPHSTRNSWIEKIDISPNGEHLAAIYDDYIFVWDINHNKKSQEHSLIYSGKYDSIGIPCLEFIDNKNVIFGNNCLLNLENPKVKKYDLLKGIHHSSNGKGLVVFRRFGDKNTWKLVNIEGFLSGETIEALDDPKIESETKERNSSWFDGWDM